MLVSVFLSSPKFVSQVASQFLMTLGGSGRQPIYGPLRGDKFTIIAVVAGRELQRAPVVGDTGAGKDPLPPAPGQVSRAPPAVRFVC